MTVSGKASVNFQYRGILTVAILPRQNASGNWVKVVQRLPVRLELDQVDPNRPLFSGISVIARVDTGYRHPWLYTWLPFERAFAAE